MTYNADEVLAQVKADRGIIPGAFHEAAALDPGVVATFHASYMHAMSEASPLTEREKQLILIAVDAAVYFHYGCKFHMEEALRAGATVEDITAALRLPGLVVGFHAPLSAYPLLREVLDAQQSSAE